MALTIGSLNLQSRLILGSGGAASHQVVLDVLQASGAELVTVALRRFRPGSGSSSLYQDLAGAGATVLPNTAGAHTAREARTLAELGREALQTNLVKLEVVIDDRTLLPDPIELVDAARELVAAGFEVFAYTNDDPALARILADTGVVAVMPLGSPIGSGMGILNPANISLIVELVDLPVILDAGIGTASDAALAMELGVDGVLVASAITRATDPVKMAGAISLAVRAGREAWEAGRISRRPLAVPSSPFEGLPDFNLAG